MVVVFDEIIPTLEGRWTRFICKQPFVRDAILTQVVLPRFSDNRTFVVVYSEAMFRKFTKFLETSISKFPELERFFECLNFIKIGKRTECKFGNLCMFVDQSNPNIVNELVQSFENLRCRDVLILHESFGFLLELLDLKEILDLFSVLPEDITLLSFKGQESRVDRIINELCDVVVRIDPDDMIDETHYIVSVEDFSDCSKEFGRFRVKEGRLVDLE